MITVIWANAQPGKISKLEKMTQSHWEQLRREIPETTGVQVDCDEDTVLLLDPSFSELDLEDWKGQDLQFTNGLIPVITQDPKGLILMQAFSSPESLELSRNESMGIYFSRSRNEIWRKGDTSGHIQKLKRIRTPKDGSFLVYEVDQEGAACHEGYYSCFFREKDKKGDLRLLNIPFLGK
ncbi:phosphoribosyl-AMP cyclohydrolase [Leptospira langatensis]|uniref:phosphoribosyl-AMP cyclohydrolase n=1 Tax=Leptospira langatensis TaxID=2484983 RepID=A0A5F1ZT24_9LEPT|nr:phosphoribosyl-AMP cyclohydrolase [Leptospira langatensis]TGK02809.1 phosphoribosyl-AMP cyclohydrolase [Leptospira langatensis]TGL39986.1 phosphoribosyl-AMP cyclohydrolase [Leptospira langatensis]